MRVTTLGWCYAAFGASMCVYLCAAGFGKWRGPDIDTGGGSGSGGSYYYSGASSYGRSSGGSWGGGK